MKHKFDLQLHASPDNLTASANIDAETREVEFVTSFALNVNALLEILGITRKVKKANGSTLFSKTASGTLESGTVAEGDEIPLSQYAVTKTAYDTIAIEKYKKAVSLEAIAEYGYDSAVEMTDDEFATDLQDGILDKMFTMLKTGTATSYEDTFQMALAMAVGNVKNKFKALHRTATGTVAFVNTLDLYRYLGGAEVTVQTAFGLDYIKNFLGADVVFISNEITENTVIATALNNIVCYYVDPADSDFAKAGLMYTTDTEDGLIGFHSQADYDRAYSAEYALLGMRLFAEYLDGIAIVTVGTDPAAA